MKNYHNSSEVLGRDISMFVLHYHSLFHLLKGQKHIFD